MTKNPNCILCLKPCENKWGNNPEPVVSKTYGVCCDACNLTLVIPNRLRMMAGWDDFIGQDKDDKNEKGAEEE